LHYKLLDAALDSKPIALARWTLPESVFKKLSTELKGEGGVLGVKGESEENLARYERGREMECGDGEPSGWILRFRKRRRWS
jgi:hypothetical protein